MVPSSDSSLVGNVCQAPFPPTRRIEGDMHRTRGAHPLIFRLEPVGTQILCCFRLFIYNRSLEVMVYPNYMYLCERGGVFPGSPPVRDDCLAAQGNKRTSKAFFDIRPVCRPVLPPHWTPSLLCQHPPPSHLPRATVLLRSNSIRFLFGCFLLDTPRPSHTREREEDNLTEISP